MNFPPFTNLTTKRLLLRQLQPDDAEEIFQLRSDEKVSALIDRPVATSIDDARQFIDKIIAAQAMMWVITLKDNPKLIGTIVYWNIVKEKDEAEVGYEMLPRYRGQGIMQEAFAALLDYGFGIMKLHSVEAIVDPQNLAS